MQFLLAYLFIAPTVIGCTLALTVCSLAASTFGADENTIHKIARFWSRMLLRLSMVRTEVIGLEKLDPHRSYILVANHQSYIDTPLVVAHLPLQFRFLAKLSLFSLPLFGAHLVRAGQFPVDRGNPRASLKTMSDAAKAISQRGVSLLIFPEGTRSPDSLQAFKDGAAYLAIKSGVPAVPVAIVGTRQILSMNSSRFRPGPTRLIVGDPIETAHMTIKDRDQLTAALHDAIAAVLGEPASTFHPGASPQLATKPLLLSDKH